MTTTLSLTIDVPDRMLNEPDPIGAAMAYVGSLLRCGGVTVHHVGQHVPGRDDGLHVDAGLLAALAEAGDSIDPLACDQPGCTERFTQPNHLKLHQRKHQTADCRWCGRAFSAVGVGSHERHCAQRPVEEVRIAAPAFQRDVPEPDPTPIMPDLGPIARRPFDPDKVRAAAGGW